MPQAAPVIASDLAGQPVALVAELVAHNLRASGLPVPPEALVDLASELMQIAAAEIGHDAVADRMNDYEDDRTWPLKTA